MITKKLQSLCAIALIALSSHCFAQCSTDCGYAPCYDTCEDCCIGGEPSGMGVYAGVDLLFWKYCAPNMDYATTFTAPVFPNEVTFSNTNIGTYQYMEHNWVPGFRINLAKYSDPCGCDCGWDFMFSYTYNQDKRTDTLTDPGFTQLVSTLIHGGTPATPNPLGVYPEQLTTTHRYRYQTMEALVGRMIELTSCQKVQPFMGAQGLKYDQVWNQLAVLTGDDQIFPISVFQSREYQARLDSTYEGLGLIVGANYFIRPSDCMELFFRGSYSILVGEQDNTNKQQFIYDTSVPLIGTFDTLAGGNWHRKQCACTSGVHLRAGASTSVETCGRELLFSLGYEFVGWFNMPQMMRGISGGQDYGLSTSTLNSRVMFHGLFLGVSAEL